MTDEAESAALDPFRSLEHFSEQTSVIHTHTHTHLLETGVLVSHATVGTAEDGAVSVDMQLTHCNTHTVRPAVVKLVWLQVKLV